jgi:hypothetical protein
MRTVCSTGETKIFPSPIWPVLAALDGGDGLVGLSAGHDDFDFDFRQEADGVFSAAVDFGVALLAAVAFDFGNRHALQAEVGQCGPHFLELEGFDHCSDELHFSPLSLSVPARRRKRNRQPGKIDRRRISRLRESRGVPTSRQAPKWPNLLRKGSVPGLGDAFCHRNCDQLLCKKPKMHII